jgi:hypothetical protein
MSHKERKKSIETESLSPDKYYSKSFFDSVVFFGYIPVPYGTYTIESAVRFYSISMGK